MLQNIRDHIQGWFASVIIALVALSFIFFGIESYLKAENPNLATVAEVNGEKITAQQLQERYHRLLDQIPNANVLDEKARQNIQQEALTQLTNELVLVQLAHELDLVVSDTELKSAIASMPAFQIDGHFSFARFNQVLMSNHLSVQQFEQQVQQMLLLNQLQNAIQSSSFVLPSEWQQSYALLEQQRDIGYFRISSKELARNFHPSDKEVKQYYGRHQSEFMQPEQVSIQYVVLSPVDLAKQLKLSDAEVKEYYQQHLTSFPKDKKFNQLKPQIIKLLRQEKTEQLLAEKSEELANLSFTHPDSLKPIAQALKLPIQQTGLFTEQGTTEGLLSDPAVVTAAFSEEVLMQGDNSNPIELNEGSLLVLRVDRHKPAAVKPLAELRPYITDELIQAQARKEAARLAKKIQAALNNDEAISQVAQQYHLVWLTRHNLNRTNATGLPLALVEATFNTPIQEGQISKAQITALNSGDYVVFKVLAHQWGAVTKLSEAKQKVWLAQLAAQQARLEYQLYEQSVIQAANIQFKKVNLPKD